ncbi:hypothetical protein F4560_004210 [Saccharothrix ecbatanensis]|uniref:DUF7919 domain-containing protein n=1 Tax=Saccharothrix ecbatanensis TaxID=1105145 RepID=A0A7W9HLD2_9PSEU|nr:hypothetical protein [Saccharothrix ecbatanensis]MBB5804442.1 hypothetical protein [Saccharothrix ecbatanensis]
MTTYEDLTPYAYWRLEPEETEPTLNVGWLGRESRFEVGEPEPGLADALLTLARFHRVHVTRGWHGCELCGPGAPYPAREPFGDGEVALGSAEIRVPGADGVVYAAPNLLHHYVVRHHYRPPAAFVRAVLAEAEARARAWEETKRSLPVGTSVHGEIRSWSPLGLTFHLDGFPDLRGAVPLELYGPGRDDVEYRVPVDAVVVGHSDQERRIILQVEDQPRRTP